MEAVIVIAGIISEEGKILITRRAETQSFSGKWEFPGGKREKNETDEECLVRELHEELGIRAKVGVFFAENTFDFGSAVIHIKTYRCFRMEGDVKLTVHDRSEWVSPQELLHYDFLAADLPILEKLAEEQKYEIG